uniref:EF-hand domain-containing protein n=1 Tax=Glossina palpalis gambiensis TaxID=67801 RepID=A0A1B0BT38_9MUSC
MSTFPFKTGTKDLRTAFDLLDRNRDGCITASELQFMLKNLGIKIKDDIIYHLIREASHSESEGEIRADNDFNDCYQQLANQPTTLEAENQKNSYNQTQVAGAQ